MITSVLLNLILEITQERCQNKVQMGKKIKTAYRRGFPGKK
jgi:hypothetical protein